VLENGEAFHKDWFYFDPERLKGRRRWGVYPATGELHALKNGEGSPRSGLSGPVDLCSFQVQHDYTGGARIPVPELNTGPALASTAGGWTSG
jgi:hypothetical protein